MSEAEGELIPIPNENASVAFIWFAVAIDFYPAIKISRKAGLEFTAELAEIFEPQDVHLEGDEWKIAGGGMCEGLQISVEKRTIRIDVLRPPLVKLEWYEQRISALLRAFEAKFEPKTALRFNVDMSGLVDLPEGVDARAFLGGYVMLMHPSKFDVIARPLHILGMRFQLPAFEDAEWDVDVRVESWGEDPRKVFLNADAYWENQTTWDSQFVDKNVGRITTVSDFMSNQLVQFLRNRPLPPEES